MRTSALAARLACAAAAAASCCVRATAPTYFFAACHSATVGTMTGCGSPLGGTDTSCTYSGPAPADGSCTCNDPVDNGCTRVTQGSAPGKVSVIAYGPGLLCSGSVLFTYTDVPTDNVCRADSSGGFVSAVVASTASYTYSRCGTVPSQVQYGGLVACASDPNARFWVSDKNDACGSLQCTGTGCTTVTPCYGAGYTGGGASDHGAQGMCLSCGVPLTFSASADYSATFCTDSGCNSGCTSWSGTSTQCAASKKPPYVSSLVSITTDGTRGVWQPYQDSSSSSSYCAAAGIMAGCSVALTTDGSCHTYTTCGGLLTGSYRVSVSAPLPGWAVALIIIFCVIVPACVCAGCMWWCTCCPCCGCGRNLAQKQRGVVSSMPPQSDYPAPQVQMMQPQQGGIEMAPQPPWPAGQQQMQPQHYPAGFAPPAGYRYAGGNPYAQPQMQHFGAQPQMQQYGTPQGYPGYGQPQPYYSGGQPVGNYGRPPSSAQNY